MPSSTEKNKLISVIIPVYNGMATLPACLKAVFASTYPSIECVVVDDGSTDESARTAEGFGALVVALDGGPRGPAFARNQGAASASGEYLFFIDADVLIAPDTVQKVMDAFRVHPEIDAVFGSYDETPSENSFLSQYKNLTHHFVHQQGHEVASTFWSGCGAVRREVFLKMGGFDHERYPRPSIEDIELGYRMIAAGHAIRLEKGIQVKHLKRWSLIGLLRTDIMDRALPWTRLIMQNRSMPGDLNLQPSQRTSAVLLGALLLLMAAAAWQTHLYFLPLVLLLFLLVVGSWGWYQGPTRFQASPGVEAGLYLLAGFTALLAHLSRMPMLLPPLALFALGLLWGRLASNRSARLSKLAFMVMVASLAGEFVILVLSYPVWVVAALLTVLTAIVVLNRRLYAFLARKQGLVFSLASLPLQLLYYLYSMAAFVLGGGLHVWETSFKPK